MVQKQNKPPPKKTSEVDRRFQLVLTLVALLKNARHKAKRSELEFMIVNQTFNLISYRHCNIWSWDGERASINAASGMIQIDPNGPYVLWLKKIIRNFLSKNNMLSPTSSESEEREGFAKIYVIAPEDCEKEEGDKWKKWSSSHALIMIMTDRHGSVFGGMWIDRDEPFNDLERALLEDLGDGYAGNLLRFDEDATTKKLRGLKSFFSLSKSNAKKALLVLIVAMFLPVRLSVTAPAEVIAHDPAVVSIPFDGTIDKVEVLPGQKVKKGDVLLRMDSTMLRNKMEVAQSEMMASEIALQKTEREVFADRTKLAEISVLKAQLEQKVAEKEFAEELLARAEIKADRDGIVIFSDPNALRGKPAQTGERVMRLADPRNSELLIRVPVNSMIEINKDVPAKFFLNVTPLGSSRATYESIGYQATQDPDGLMTYKVRAKFLDTSDPPRIGWTGTGKIYGDRTIVAFNVLRRPFVTLRRKLGL